jgi:hypothetical protein
MKITKIKKLKWADVGYERQEAEEFLAKIPKENLIDVKIQSVEHTYVDSFILVVYQEEEKNED